MKVLIIGGVAAGTKVAAKLKRENRDYDVRILTKSKDISYAGCGLPYYVGQIIPDKDLAYANGDAKEYKVIDVSISPSIDGAPFVDLTKINGKLLEFAKDEKLLLVCTKGKRAYMLQNRLKHYGYTNTLVLEGGITFNELTL